MNTKNGYPKEKMCLLIEDFINSCHLKARTEFDYKKAICSFVDYSCKGSNDLLFPGKLEQENILGWIKEVKEYYSLQGTVLGWIRIISRFLTFLHSREIIQDNPLRQLKKQYPIRGLSGIILALLSSSPAEALQNLKPHDQFISPLGEHMRDFIKLSRAQGKKYKNEEEVLLRFDRFLMTFDIPPRQLSEEIMEKWLRLFPGAKSGNRYINFGIVRRFCAYLRRFDAHAYLPDPSMVPTPIHLSPHIFSESEIKVLLKAARHLKATPRSPLRPRIFHLLFSLLYTCGLRISEVLKLRLCDIDMKNECLYIRDTKFFKSRMVMLSPSMMEELKSFLQLLERRRERILADAYLFRAPRKKGHYSKSAVRTTFYHLLKVAGIKKSQGHKIRVHDLRHSMAVHRLEKWYEEGENVQAKLGLLSTYLGHSKVESTQTYLTMTPELLEQASLRFNEYFKTGERK